MSKDEFDKVFKETYFEVIANNFSGNALAKLTGTSNGKTKEELLMDLITSVFAANAELTSKLLIDVLEIE
ncbi:hypothetical protein [Aminipila terrae]|uniref:Uncharacterized protein n=1 Tax=Aminipila terrae TaxID=2697030 RepID=A0A6P1MNM5_9FIRM|nr:hypothetical protein [Aminipila terrae]QHI73276.1 hypothetical protein Ami3637_13615 [Aminipila terrae]